MNVKNVKIYISTIKNVDRTFSDGYELVLAGSSLNSIDNYYIRDDIGENISFKNESYCELTVLYWIWKNSKSDIVGLEHHRRFFYNKKLFPKILTIEEITDILEDNDIIIPRAICIGDGIERQYKDVHIGKDYDICRKIIGDYFPEFLDAFNDNSKLHFLHPYNMLITRKEILDDYCSFLFPLLEKVEEQIDVSKRDNYQRRVFGFLAERLFQTWLLKNSKLSKVEYPVYNSEESFVKQKIKSMFD